VQEGQTVNRAPGDLRIGAINLAQPAISLPSAGELLMPGPLDPSSGLTYIAASPLTGIRLFSPTEITGFGATNTQYNPVTNQMTPDAVQKMRDEMNQAAGVMTQTPAGRQQQLQQQQQQDNQPGNSNNGAGGANQQGGANNGAAQQVPGATPIVAQPIQQPGAGAQAMNTAVTAQAGNLGTDQGVRQRQVANIPPPEKQSALYAQLLQKHEQGVADKNISDEEAARQFNQLQMAAKQNPGQPGAPAANAQPQQPGAAQPGTGAAQATPQGAAPVPPPAGNKAAPGAATPADQNTVAGTPDYAKRGEQLMKEGATKVQEDQKKRGVKPEPVKVPSLATGIKGKGLEQIMREAEDLMKQGKFTSALDRYDQAQTVAPNNPLISLGRAHAELGAEYYARADADLHKVFQANPALLNGQYDLASMIGEQRLQLLVRDLKEIANRDQKDSRAVFLLGYIAYNTGHEQNAEGYIDLADKRSGGTDPLFKLLRDNWALPGGATTQPSPAATPEMNK
jgi:tetratricopeptide (TPR) repeat protein